MTTYYLDIGVIRIQEYINRTSGSDEHVLRRRRGASRMVAQATHVASITEDFNTRLAADFTGWTLEPNDETYDTEGVAHLKLERASGASGGVDDLATALLGQVRAIVPQAYLRASWAAADSYGQALPQLKAVLRGEARQEATALDVLPPFRDEVLSARCDSCGQAVAAVQGNCVDCRRREELGGRDVVDEALSPQDEALRVLRVNWPGLSQARDLSSLAGLPKHDDPGQGGSGKRNHLATVYADGNNVGAIFRALAGDLERAKRVSEALNCTTKGSGHQALADLIGLMHMDGRCQQSVTLPGEVTTLAADDVLITVPASYGWRFVRTLVGTFNADIAEALKEEDLAVMPSLTAGICFHHCKMPIEEAVSMAFGAMRDAKDACRGTESAIGWTDATSGEPVRTREFDWFTGHLEGLAEVASMPHSQAAKYEQFLAQLSGNDPGRLVEFLRKEAARDGAQAWIGTWLVHEAAEPTSNLDLATETLRALDDALSLRDWYPSGTGEDA